MEKCVHQDGGGETEHIYLPQNACCYEIQAEANELLEDLGISPGDVVDFLDVVSTLGIEYRSYSELGIKGLVLHFFVSKYGLSFYDRIKQRFVIYYNEELPCIEKQKTLAHELGHIQRGHYLKPISKKLAEAEANCFACCLFAVIKPVCRVRNSGKAA